MSTDPATNTPRRRVIVDPNAPIPLPNQADERLDRPRLPLTAPSQAASDTSRPNRYRRAGRRAGGRLQRSTVPRTTARRALLWTLTFCALVATAMLVTTAMLLERRLP